MTVSRPASFAIHDGAPDFARGVLLVLAGVLLSVRTDAQSSADTARSHVTRNSSDDRPFWAPQVLGAQINAIAQNLAPFHSPYSGPSSLDATGDHGISHVYGVYIGAEPFVWRDARGRRTTVQAYLDVEMARGQGVSHATGLAGVTNGDVLRAGSADLGNGPYVARAFVRITHPLGKSLTLDTLPRGIDQLPGATTASRIEVTAGKIATSDLFDVNRYANTTRTQYMNWGLFQNTAWDFAADTRGYTNGIAVSWITPRWSLRVGSFQMPLQANGNKFDGDLRRARGDNFELTVSPGGGAGNSRMPTIRLLGYVNQARMGRYAVAIAKGQAQEVAPNIVADDAPGRTKYGWGINVEQPLADDGETGAFLRAGWNDGANESFAFTEVDRHVSAGVQVSGAHWMRRDDRFAVAVLEHGIVEVHQRYLAAGGVGFLLGDGQLNYGREQIVESFYRVQATAHLQVRPDLQVITNPGYNRDRGPAVVASLRVNLKY